ncbi:unnamed protein product [Clonostachys rosea f. rosea IK726]|uniref:Uncharacterized protein n=1 Tax=Clonostachys rosea f. rosea IK726 TaxID=1349383 RepID=A0ACA9UIL7_BIOOC|nr:unnamed protein product [Clonostachys rosea f. rosea IK726]
MSLPLAEQWSPVHPRTQSPYHQPPARYLATQAGASAGVASLKGDARGAIKIEGSPLAASVGNSDGVVVVIQDRGAPIWSRGSPLAAALDKRDTGNDTAARTAAVTSALRGHGGRKKGEDEGADSHIGRFAFSCRTSQSGTRFQVQGNTVGRTPGKVHRATYAKPYIRVGAGRSIGWSTVTALKCHEIYTHIEC